MLQLVAMNFEDERYLQKTWPFRPVTRQEADSPRDLQYSILPRPTGFQQFSLKKFHPVITLDRGKSK